MKINSRNNAELLEFFEAYKDLTVNEQAIVASVCPDTIVDWKRKCGIMQTPRAGRRVKKSDEPLPKDWDNKEWFEKTYEKLGLRAMARLLGKKDDWKFVANRLKRYGIKRKTFEERTASSNPCCDEGWLHYYYASREDYLEWCSQEGIEPCDEGGQELTLTKCAKLASVSRNTIANWLALYRMKIRGVLEARIKKPKREMTPEQSRVARDNYFKNYRKGTINMNIRGKLFSNGTRLDKKKVISKKPNKNSRGRLPYPSSSSELSLS